MGPFLSFVESREIERVRDGDAVEDGDDKQRSVRRPSRHIYSQLPIGLPAALKSAPQCSE